MRTILLVFDRLPAWQLGCYGNFDEATPTFDDFAAQSAVFDHAYSSPDEPSWSRCSLPTELPTAYLRIAEESGPAFDGILRVSVAELLERDESGRPDLFADDVWNRSLVLIEVSDLDRIAYAGDEGTSRESDDIDDTADPAALADAVLHGLLRQILPRLADDDLLIVTADRGDPQDDPTDNPGWLKSVGEAAAHVPLFIHACDAETVGRFDPFVTRDDVEGLIRSHAQGGRSGLNEWRRGLCRESIRYSSPDAQVSRTREWVLVERKSAHDRDEAGTPDDDSVIRLYRQPEDPWLVRDVSGEYVELTERYRRSGTVAQVGKEH